jgi:hypothetical protein
MDSVRKLIFSFPSFTVLVQNTSWYCHEQFITRYFYYHQNNTDSNAAIIRINVNHMDEKLTKERAGLQAMCEIPSYPFFVIVFMNTCKVISPVSLKYVLYRLLIDNIVISNKYPNFIYLVFPYARNFLEGR